MLEDDECIRVWRGRLGSSWVAAFSTFRRFYDEALMKNSVFAGMRPSDLVEWQVEARGRDRYRILRLAQEWVNGQSLRYGTKVIRLSQIRSFFLHNQAELPSDRSFHFTSDTPAVEGNLTLEAFQRILLNCNKMYRTVFLMMGQGLLGEGELVHVNVKYCDLILESLTRNVGVFKLVLPGRKRSRNIKNFYSMLSTKSDWGDAMRDYLKSLPSLPRGGLFRNQQGTPLMVHNIRNYFHQRAVETGVIKQHSPPCSRCNGETVRVKKKYSEGVRRIGYQCRECGCVDWACEKGYKFSHIRYGVNPHEIRDLMRSRWRASGAKLVVAEFMMEHSIDANEYDKMKYTPGYAMEEYRRALAWLNVLSESPEKISKFLVDRKLEASEAKVDVLSREVADLRRKLDVLDNPNVVEWLESLGKKKK